MERQSEWQRGRSQGPATSDPDVIHAGRQFEETDIEGDTNSSELAHTTPPNCAQMEDSQTCVVIGDGPNVEMSSSPESTTDSSGQGRESKIPTDPFDVPNGNLGWSVPSRSDPWNHLSRWDQTSPEYIQELRQRLDSFQGLSSRPADATGIAVAQSVQTDSGYASIPKDVPAAPKLQTQEVIHNALSARSVSEPILVQNAENTGENQTVYSDQNSEDADRTKEYIWEFTNYLYQQLEQKVQLTSKNIEKATELLPYLLAGYAEKIGHASHAQTNRDIRYFVHKHRKLIPKLLNIIYKDDQLVTEQEPDAELMSTNDKIHLLWSKGSNTHNILDPDRDLNPVANFSDNDDDNNDESPLVGDFSQYREVIIKDPSFEWLIQRFSTKLDISPTESHAMTAISLHIVKALHNGNRISRTRALKPSTVIFNINCDIPGFRREQRYHESAADVIPNVVALTGTDVANTQISSPEQYLRQVWPIIGCHLLETIQGALRVYDPAFPFRNSETYTYADRTKIKVSIGENTIRIEVTGTAYAIAEIAEQIGWLATTLRSGHRESQISFCHPEIVSFRVKANRNLHAEEDEYGKVFVCKMEVANDEIVPNQPSISGQCWLAMFNNPIVVKGYPINPREGFMPIAGLEMPFEEMIAFADTPYITTFENKIVLKGFSTAYIATGIHDEIISWHLIYNESGAHLPYGDPRMQQGIPVTPDQLRSARRHVVGWCANAQNNIGSPEANYDIKWSGLSEAEGGVVLDQVQFGIGAGPYMNARAVLTRGFKDTPKREAPTSCRSLVQYIGRHYFTLYDVEEKRAYLSSGLAVLLHLIRTSLRYGEIKHPDDYYTDAIETLNKIPLSAQGTQAAKQILYDSANWVIKLYLDEIEVTTMKEKYFFFEDRVKEICLHLDRAIVHAKEAANQGILKGTRKKVLRGFNFMDVAVCDPLSFVAEKLQIAGSSVGWTDLIKPLGALTLFGNKFGELIKPGAGSPTKSCRRCGFVASLPSGEYNLAVCVDVMEDILERSNGCKDATPWQLPNNLECDIDRIDFEPCQCASSNGRGNKHDRIDRVQALAYKNSFLGNTAPANPIDIESNGAVIFGHKRIDHKRNKNKRNRFIRNSPKAATIKRGCSPSDSAQLQAMNAAVEVPPLSATQDRNFEANENQLSDTVSSATPDTFTSSGASGLDSNNTTIEQQSRTSNVGSPKSKSAVVTPQNTSVTPPIVSRKRYGRKVRDICERAWKKTKTS